MEHKPALYALIRLHSEIGGRIKQNASEAQKLRADMHHVEHVLKLLEPGFNCRTIAARRKNARNILFKRGHITRGVVDLLKAAEAPMSAEEIGVSLLKEKGVEPDRTKQRAIKGGINSALKNNEGKMFEAVDGRPRRWRMISPG